MPETMIASLDLERHEGRRADVNAKSDDTVLGTDKNSQNGTAFIEDRSAPAISQKM